MKKTDIENLFRDVSTYVLKNNLAFKYEKIDAGNLFNNVILKYVKKEFEDNKDKYIIKKENETDLREIKCPIKLAEVLTRDLKMMLVENKLGDMKKIEYSYNKRAGCELFKYLAGTRKERQYGSYYAKNLYYASSDNGLTVYPVIGRPGMKNTKSQIFYLSENNRRKGDDIFRFLEYNDELVNILRDVFIYKFSYLYILYNCLSSSDDYKIDTEDGEVFNLTRMILGTDCITTIRVYRDEEFKHGYYDPCFNDCLYMVFYEFKSDNNSIKKIKYLKLNKEL